MQNQVELSASERAQYRRKIIANGGSAAGLSDAELLDKYNAMGEANTAQPVEPTANNDDLAQQIAALLSSRPSMDEGRVVQLIREHSSAPVTHNVRFHVPEVETLTIESAHPALPNVTRAVQIGGALNVGWPFLVGPAGSGKTTLAGQVAEGLGLPFYAKESLQDKFELVGFIDAAGNYQETDLYRAMKHGGVFLFDELDRSAPEAIVAFNMALANGRFTFPNGETVERHQNCFFIAAGNTFGNGPSREYSTAQVLDGSTLDRFTRVNVDYDAAIEHSAAMSAALSFNENASIDAIGAIVGAIQKARTFARENGIDAIFSPRQSMVGACQVAQGVALEDVKRGLLSAQLTDQQIAQMGA